MVENIEAKTKYLEKFNVYESTDILNNFGMPGSLDTPTAQSFPDGQFSISSSVFGGSIRVNLSFQITESLTGAFRYSRIPSSSGDYRGYYWDRSFDVHYLAYKESKYIPSIAIGLRDFIGTGIYAGEYVVATKSFNNKLKLSGGIGWGRLSGKNSFSNIFGLGNQRSSADVGRGGTAHLNRLFSGKNSPFLSAAYNFSENIDLIAELSSDPYIHETSSIKGMSRETDLNFGFKYKFAPSLTLTGMIMHGNAIGLTGSMAINPKNAPYKSGLEPAPMPILIGEAKISDTEKIIDATQRLLELDGIQLIDLEFQDSAVEIYLVDRNYYNVAQMIGRVSRIISKTLPKKYKIFNIYIFDHHSGFLISEIEIDRKSLMENELLFDGPDNLWKNVNVKNTAKKKSYYGSSNFSPLTWSFYPYLDVMLFDPHAPIRWHIGLEAKARYRMMKYTDISGSLKQPLAGTMDDIKRGPKEGLPNVRSDFMYYHRDIGSKVFVDNLTLNQFFKPFPNIFAQVNLGYLEMMYAGIRSEIIWKDSDKPYGIGLDLAKVRKRATEANFRLKSDAHSIYLASFYYDLPHKWNLKIDGGKYLAGDYGSTVSVARNFNNGWEIGAFATLTDVKFSTFGEGSFDKGITLKVPLHWLTGKKSKYSRSTVIRPISGDGGATLYLSDEKYLYNNIKAYDENSFQSNWKRVYR